MEYIYIGCLITGIIVATLSALWQYSHSGLYPYISHKKILLNLFIGFLATAITGLCLLIIIQYKDEINKSMLYFLNSLNIKDKHFFTIFPILVLIFYTYKTTTRK